MFLPEDLSESAENDLEVVVCSDGVEFTDEEDVFGRGHVRLRKITHNLENRGLSLGLLLLKHLFKLGQRLPNVLLKLLISPNPTALK
jgi:hypothetical protein